MKLLEKLKQKNENPFTTGSINIVFLGDSVTQGCFELYKKADDSIDTVFESKSSYSVKLKSIMEILYPRVPFNIINSGISGDNAENGLQRLDRDVIRFSPDLVVVCFGLNDSTNGKDYLKTFEKNLDQIFKKLINNKIEVIFMTPNMMNLNVSPKIIDKDYQNLAQYLLKNEKDGILEEFVNKSILISQLNNVAVCDCYKKWKLLSLKGVNTTELLSNFINHPTREMHWLFAYSLLETIFSYDV